MSAERVVKKESARAFIDRLGKELSALPVHRHPFLIRFQQGVTSEQLRRFLVQWYLFGIRFRKILIGLLYNLSDQDEAVSLEILRVLYSEYGHGVREDVHSTHILRLIDRLEIDRSDLVPENLCSEASEYLETVGEIYFHGDVSSALGASFGIEATAGLAYRYLYGGLLVHVDLSLDDIRFFEVHLFEERQHGTWLEAALLEYGRLETHQDRIRSCAFLAMGKWHCLWNGIYRVVFDDTPETFDR